MIASNVGCPRHTPGAPIQPRRGPVCASHSTVTSSSLLHLKLLKQQKHGVRHGPPSEPSTAVLLEERRCSGEQASSSGAAAAPAGTAAVAAAVATEHSSIGDHAAPAVLEELDWLRRELSRRVEQEEAEGQQPSTRHSGSTSGSLDLAGIVEAAATGDGAQQQAGEEQQWQHAQQQGRKQQQRRPARQRAGRQAHGTFAEWSAYCQLHASSPLLPHWLAAAEGLRSLVASVRGPQQAQQAWEVVCLLASRPLPQQTAKLVAHQAVELVTFSLDKGDYSILHAMLAQQHPFAFGRRAVEALLRAACAADVELGELQAILRAVPQSQLTNRAFFVLVKSFAERGQVTEALHCQHQMQVLGLRPSPALEAALKRLREGRAAGTRASVAQR